MLNIRQGLIVSGASGKKFLVDRVEGDFVYSGKIKIKRELILQVEASNLNDRLDYISTLSKSDAKNQLLDLLVDFSVNGIYESSLDLATYLGKFIRTQLHAIRPIEFGEIGNDGSEGKYGVLTFPDHERLDILEK
jgi:hypothetical protein